MTSIVKGKFKIQIKPLKQLFVNICNLNEEVLDGYLFILRLFNSLGVGTRDSVGAVLSALCKNRNELKLGTKSTRHSTLLKTKTVNRLSVMNSKIMPMFSLDSARALVKKLKKEITVSQPK